MKGMRSKTVREQLKASICWVENLNSFFDSLKKMDYLKKKEMDGGKYICKQTEKGALEGGESTDG